MKLEQTLERKVQKFGTEGCRKRYDLWEKYLSWLYICLCYIFSLRSLSFTFIIVKPRYVCLSTGMGNLLKGEPWHYDEKLLPCDWCHRLLKIISCVKNKVRLRTMDQVFRPLFGPYACEIFVHQAALLQSNLVSFAWLNCSADTFYISISIWSTCLPCHLIYSKWPHVVNSFGELNLLYMNL